MGVSAMLCTQCRGPSDFLILCRQNIYAPLPIGTNAKREIKAFFMCLDDQKLCPGIKRIILHRHCIMIPGV